MSTIQQRASMRWLLLCRLKGTVTFEDARKLIPQHCLLKGETGLNTRNEAEWLQGMRNFKRDIDQGKERYFCRAPNGGIRLSVLGQKELDPMISEQQLNQVIRKR